MIHGKAVRLLGSRLCDVAGWSLKNSVTHDLREKKGGGWRSMTSRKDFPCLFLCFSVDLQFPLHGEYCLAFLARWFSGCLDLEGCVSWSDAGCTVCAREKIPLVIRVSSNRGFLVMASIIPHRGEDVMVYPSVQQLGCRDQGMKPGLRTPSIPIVIIFLAIGLTRPFAPEIS